MQIARAKVAEASSEDKAVEEEVARAMQQGNGLVQATLEHLETAERSWGRFVELGGEASGAAAADDCSTALQLGDELGEKTIRRALQRV